MKRKALFVVLACVMGLATLSVGSAVAGYYTCTVNAAGCAGTFYTLNLTDNGGAFTATDFVIDAAAPGAKEMLAACLTAWSNAGKLKVWLNSISPSANVTSATCTN